MIKLKYLFFFAAALIAKGVMATDWSVDVVVAKDGSGNYTTINEALSANPNDGSNYVIFIKNGVYDEKLFISQNNITLLGEDRYETIITQSILRRIFRENNDSDWGGATINIADNVTDLTLANLTVRNNFADLNPDVENNNDHTMAIRGGGDKVIIVNCNILATGGDTLSLWNTNGGRFYHSGCFFEGYVDYVCPRGYCYISNCDFFGHNNNASIWHDGSGGKDHKLVVKNSYFEGVENFALGRFHRMAAFYLLDCDFSKELRDNGGILYVGDSSVQDRDKLIYGVRTYYDRCSRETGNYEWHKDNLETADGSPSREEVTDKWTFNDTWNPEKDIDGLLECAFLPQPGYRAKNVELLPNLRWLSGKNVEKHLVYFGNSSDPEFLGETTDTNYLLTNELASATQFFWRVDEVLTSTDTVKGSLWSFFTGVFVAPGQAFNPYPPVDTNFFLYTLRLDWEANSLEVDSFFIYFGSADNLELLSKQTEAGYYLYGPEGDSTYYWRVDTKNEYGTTQGPLWFFNYKPSETLFLGQEVKGYSHLKLYPNPVKEELTLSFNFQKEEVVNIFIYNSTGQLLHTENLGMIPKNQYDYNLKISDIVKSRSDQIYILNIAYNEKIETFPILLR